MDKHHRLGRGEKRLGMWGRVQAYESGDTSVDLGPFVPPFQPADREGAIALAYDRFVQRYGLGPG
jgi:hypothetical protein